MISKKVKTLKPSAVQALAAQAKEFMAQGRDVVNLSIGEPTWDAFKHSKKTAISAIEKGCSWYSPASGYKPLKEAVSKDLNRHLKLDYPPENITVSVGSKYVLFSALQVLADPEDEVLIPAPYWVSYPSLAALSGAKAVILETSIEDHKITPSILEKYLNDKTKILILNSPNNPTGLVYSLEELSAIGETLRKYPRVFVLSDDIYNRMALDRGPEDFAPHLLEACPDLKDRTVVINAASKNYAMPGWRVGWAAAGELRLIKAMNAYQSQTVSCAPTVGQVSMASSFSACEGDLKKVHELLRKRRSLITSLLGEIKGLSFQKPEGAFYLWLDVRSLFSKKYKGQVLQTSFDVFRILKDDFYLFTAPGEAFGRGGWLRLHFAVSAPQLEATAARLKQFTSRLQ